MALNTADALGLALDAALTPLFADSESPPAQLDVMKAIATVISDHIVANLEINGVIVDAGPPVGTVVASGVAAPGDGGLAIQTAQVAAAGSPQLASQSNNGLGLVA
jgi:hypothetical protein